MIEIRAPNGDIVNFPDGTADDEIVRVMRAEYGGPEEAAPEPELTVGRAAGLGGRAAVQSIPGAVLGLPGLVYDAVQEAANLGYRGIDAALGTDLATRHDRGRGGTLGTSRNLSKVGEMGADALGLPKPETAGERVAVTAGQTALEALGGAGIARGIARTIPGTATGRVMDELAAAPKTQAAIGGLAGGGAQVAIENEVNPLIGMGIGLGAGIGGVAAGAGARAGLGRALDAADSALLRSREAQERAAANTIRSRASDPDAALGNLEEGAGGELVPGSKPTTFQATGDEGLGALERELRTENQGAFVKRREDQNSARLEALRSVGGEGEASDIVTSLRQQLDEIEQMTSRAEASAREAAEGAAERIRPGDTAEGLGRSLRGRMSDAESAARLRERSLWDAVDPDGNLTVPTQAAKQIASELYKKLTRSAGLGVTAEERQFADLISDFRPVEPFRELIDLSSQIKAAMRGELVRNGRTPSYARLTQLNQSVRSIMERSAAERIATDPVAKGQFQSYLDEWRPGSSQGAGSSARATGTLRPGGVSGMVGSAAPQGGQSGTAARGAGVSGQAQRGRPLSLTQFIAKNGGLPLDAESTARDFGSISVKGYGRLARPDGRSIDGYWRNKLIDEGYLRPDEDGGASRDITRELFDAIESERLGRATFSARDELDLGGRAVDGPEAEHASNVRMIRDVLKDNGIGPREASGRAVDEAAEMLARGDETDPFTAYERALIGADDEGPVRVSLPENDGPVSEPATGGFRDDPEAGKRYKAATEATRERVGTFNKGYAGQILRQGEDRKSFRMSDASVTANAFKPGPTGGERIKALVKAGASESQLGEIAASSLYKSAFKDGAIDPKAFQRWRSTHESALGELPEDVRAKFANAALATRALEQAAAQRKAQLDAFNKSVLGQVAKVDPDDLGKTIGGILNSRDAVSKMRTLSQAANGNPQAKEGLRRAVAEWIEGRFISNKEVGTSGENAIRADAFQSFIKDKGVALRTVFDGPELLRMQAIADDIRRAERTLTALKDPAGPSTASDLRKSLDKLAKQAGEVPLIAQILIGAGTGGSFFGIPGAVVGVVGAVGKHTLGTIRAAGLKKVDDLVLEMMLDPRLAQAGLAKAATKPDTGSQLLLSQRLARLSPFAVAGSAGDQ